METTHFTKTLVQTPRRCYKPAHVLLSYFACTYTNKQTNTHTGSLLDLPSRRGCSTASERRLTTVSRPFTSADTAYMVVSLHRKIKRIPKSCVTNNRGNNKLLLGQHGHTSVRFYNTETGERFPTLMIGSHIFLRAFPASAGFHLCFHTEL